MRKARQSRSILAQFLFHSRTVGFKCIELNKQQTCKVNVRLLFGRHLAFWQTSAMLIHTKQCSWRVKVQTTICLSEKVKATNMNDIIRQGNSKFSWHNFLKKNKRRSNQVIGQANNSLTRKYKKLLKSKLSIKLNWSYKN